MKWHADLSRPPWKPLDNRERHAMWQAKYSMIHEPQPNQWPWKWRTKCITSNPFEKLAIEFKQLAQFLGGSE